MCFDDDTLGAGPLLDAHPVSAVRPAKFILPFNLLS